MTSFFPDCWLFNLWTNSLWLPKKNQTDFNVAVTWLLQKRDTFPPFYPESSFLFLIGSPKATEFWLYCACANWKKHLVWSHRWCFKSPYFCCFETSQNQACNRVALVTNIFQACAVVSEDSRNKISLFPAPNSQYVYQ